MEWQAVNCVCLNYPDKILLFGRTNERVHTGNRESFFHKKQ